MKKLISIFVLTALVVAGCGKYDDSELRERIGKLETSMNQLTGYQTLLQNLSAGKTVTAYSQSGNEITLTFSDGKSLTFNIKGEKGESVKGDPGENGKTPQFKIENETWKVSYDEGKTWADAGSAIDRSLIKDIKPNAAGDTLNITLADGTVIPVFYGQKEGYGFEVAGGRRCFAFYEDLAAERLGRITLDYALTGDLAGVDDVKFVTNIEFYPIPSLYPDEAVTITPKDAKSGTITIKRQQAFEGGAVLDENEYLVRFPGMNIDIMAFFPDGSVRVQKLRVMYEEVTIFMSSIDGGPGFYIGDDGYVWIDLPAEAGSVDFTVYHQLRFGPSDSEMYDGAPLPQRPFSGSFYTRQWGSSPGTNAWDVTTSVGETQVGNGGYTYIYPVTFNYNANTSTKERRTYFDFIMKNDPERETGGYVYWTIYVHQGHN